MAINDALGIGLMVGLRAAGVQVPAEISVVGIDNIALAGLAEPGLTSIGPPLAEMAQLMVERLIGRINNDSQPPGSFSSRRRSSAGVPSKPPVNSVKTAYPGDAQIASSGSPQPKSEKTASSQ